MSSQPRPRIFAGLRQRLTLLLGLALLPVIALLVWSAVQEHAQQHRAAETELGRTAEVMAQAQAQTIASTRTLLAVLAQLPEIQSAGAGTGERAPCDERLAQVLALHPDYQLLGVANRDGEVMCSTTAAPPGTSIADGPAFQQALATGRFTIGEYQLTRPMNQPGLGLTYPILGADGTVQAVVAAALDLSALSRVSASIALPGDAVLALLDHNGTVLLRWPEPEGWVGQTAGGTALAEALQAGSGVGTMPGLDSQERVYAYLTVPGTEDSRIGLALGRPVGAVYGAADQVLWQNLVGTGLIVALALLATWLSSQALILMPLDRLAGATRRLAAGDQSARVGQMAGAGELGQMALAFDQLAAALEQREAERDRLIAAERTARDQAEAAAGEARRATERTARLQAATAALSQALTPDDVTAASVRQGTELLGVTAGAISLLRAGDLVVTEAAIGYSDETRAAYRVLPLAAPLPTTEVIRTGQPLFLGNWAAAQAHYPELTESDSSGFAAVVALPLHIDGACVGALTFSFAEEHVFAPEDRAFLEALAQQSAQALERARLYAAAQAAREAAEQAAERTARLQAVTAALAEALTPAEVAEVMVAQSLVAMPAQAAGVWVLDASPAEGGPLRLGHSSGYAPSVVEAVRVVPLTAGTPVAWAAANGEALWIESHADSAARFPLGSAGREASGLEGAAVLPLEVGTAAGLSMRRLGVMALSFAEPRVFTPADQSLLLTLARQCAQALERARLYAAEQAARLAAERAAGRTGRLQAITAILSEVLTPKGVVDVVFDQAMQIVGADAGAIVLLADDGQTLDVAHTRNFPDNSELPTIPLNSLAPAAEAVRTGRPLWLETQAEFAASYPAYAERRRIIGFESVAYVPLTVETRVLGALAVNFASRHVFEPAERNLLLALARQGAQALERTRLFERERLARSAAETAQQRLAVLAEASTVVSATREPAATLQALADLLVPMSADVVSLFELNDGGQLVRAVHAAVAAEQAERLRAAEATLRPILEGLPGALGRAAWGGQAVLLAQLPPGMPAAAAQLIEAMQLRSAIVAPLLAPGRVLGGLILAYTSSERAYGRDDIGFADELARRAALGLENARLFAEAQAMNAGLEARVTQRTAQLQDANASLEAEVSERKRVESELDASREQLRGLTAHLQDAREEERRRISREIHDELGGALTGLKMDVAAIRRNMGEDEASLLGRLEALSEQIDGTVQTVRRIATDLRPALLDDFGLAAAMDWQLAEFKQRAGLEAQFTTNLDGQAWDAEGSIALFRVFQETLTNVARHAQAGRVEVSLLREGEELMLKVHDNGRGIQTAALAGAKSLGLAGIRERVRLLDGQVMITGGPGEGTSVLIRLPLRRVTADHWLPADSPPVNSERGQSC